MRLALLTHEPFYPPSGGGSAEANYLVSELTRRGHEVHLFCPDFPDRDAVAARFGITVHPFTGWEMGRYTRLRSLKYLAYPGALRRLVRRTARDISFDAILSQHAISAVAAGKLKADLGVPMVMNFLDFLTGFMESWPAWAMPRFVLRRLMAYELSLPKRHDADAVLTVSDELARRFAETGYAADRLHPIHYGHDAKLFQPRTENREPRTEYLGTVAMHGSFDTHHLGPIAIRDVPRLGQYRFARFAFRRQGPGTLRIELHRGDADDKPFIYSAGPDSRSEIGARSVWSGPLSDRWIVITRDVFRDFEACELRSITIRNSGTGTMLFDHLYFARHPSDFELPDQQ